MVPSSPKVPCMTGQITSKRCAPAPRSSGTRAAAVGSAVGVTRRPAFQISGNILTAPSPTSQWASLVIPMGTASYLSGSRPRMTEAAEAKETSCSPERPPNRTPTRRRFLLSGVTNLPVLLGEEKLWMFRFQLYGQSGEKGKASRGRVAERATVRGAGGRVAVASEQKNAGEGGISTFSGGRVS